MYFVFVHVVYMGVSADIRTAEYRSIVVETSVRKREFAAFYFFLFLFFYSSFSYDFIKLDPGQKTIQRTITNMEKFYLIFWTERERISISNSL